MRFLRVVSLYLLLWVVVGIGYVLAGGHMHIVFQPFEILMIGAIYGVAFTISSLAKPDLLQQRRMNKICFLIAGVIVPSMGLIHTMGFLDQGMQVLAEHVSAAAMAIPHALLVYLAVDLEMAIGTSNSKAPVKVVVSRSLGVFGGFATASFIALASWVLVDESLNPMPKVDWKAREAYIQEAEASYAKANCAVMPQEKRWELLDAFDAKSRTPSAEK